MNLFVIIVCYGFAAISPTLSAKDFIGDEVPSTSLAVSTNGMDKVVWRDAGMESTEDLDVEHESNGPEGARDVPIQRLSLQGSVLVVAMLIASGGLIALAGKKTKATNSPHQCQRSE